MKRQEVIEALKGGAVLDELTWCGECNAAYYSVVWPNSQCKFIRSETGHYLIRNHSVILDNQNPLIKSYRWNNER